MCVCFTHSPSKLSNSRTLPEERWCCGLQWVSKSQTPWTDRTQQQETRQSNYISTVSHRQISPSRRRSEDVLFKLFWRRKQAMLRSVDAAVGQCSREQQRRTTAHQTTVQQQVNQTWSGWTDVAAKNKTGLQTVKQTGGSPNMFRKISPAVMVWNTTSRQKTSKTEHCQIDLCIDSQHILSWGNMEGPRALRKKK